MMQRSNRKSHLTAPLSPATQALLRSEGPFSGGQSPGKKDTANLITPTSGVIPIATSASIQTFPEQSIPRVMSDTINGNGAGSSRDSSLNRSDRPSFPPRTSSSNVVRTREEEFAYPSMNIPIRPAPPPSGPLPQPPGGLIARPVSSRRPNQYAYPNGEGQPI
jgi:hypothetical protein